MKPDDIAQWAWGEAVFALYGQAPDEWVERQVVIISRCARALEKARSEAFEECAKIAEWYADTNSEFLPEEVVIACGQTATDISQAIRQHSQKGRDT